MDEEDVVKNWGVKELMRWYKRGKEKVDKVLRIEVLLRKIQNIDLYVKEMMQLDLASMKRI